MMILTDRATGRAVVVNEEYLMAAWEGVDGATVITLHDDSTIPVSEDVWTVSAWLGLEVEAVDAAEAPQEPADEEIKVSGVPYAVSVASIAERAGPPQGHPRGSGPSSGPKPTRDQTDDS